MFRKASTNVARVNVKASVRETAGPVANGNDGVARFRVVQPLPVSPAALEAALDKLNVHCDGELYLKPMWTDCADGGGLECTVRRNKPVKGKRSLRVRFNFENWSPTAVAMWPRTVSSRQGGPLASRHVSRSQPAHHLCFEASDGVRQWSEKHMITVTSLLCLLLGWTPSGGIGLRTLHKTMEKLKRTVGHNVRGCPFPRRPVPRASGPAKPISTALCAPASAAPPPG